MNTRINWRNDRPGTAAAAALLHEAQVDLDRLFPGTPAVGALGNYRLLAELRCGRGHDVTAVHR